MTSLLLAAFIVIQFPPYAAFDDPVCCTALGGDVKTITNADACPWGLLPWEHPKCWRPDPVCCHVPGYNTFITIKSDCESKRLRCPGTHWTELLPDGSCLQN
jgi:hypothetical protein